MNDFTIINADIVLTGVALSDIYINKDYLLLKGMYFADSNQIIKNMLNAKTRELSSCTR